VSEQIQAKQFISGLSDITAALSKSHAVFCKVWDEDAFAIALGIDTSLTFHVRDVRKKNGVLTVQILEGWFVPAEVWIE
jgi:hypothetical protein